MQGVVLQTYGSGNAPDNRPDLINILKEASDIGVIIINITQCTKGCVNASYATGKVPVYMMIGLFPNHNHLDIKLIMSNIFLIKTRPVQ